MDAAVVKALDARHDRPRGLYRAIGKKLLDEAVAVPMYDQMDSYATSKRLKVLGPLRRADVPVRPERRRLVPR